MPDVAMYGVSAGMREALQVIAQGGAKRYVQQKNYWSMHGTLDMRCVFALIKRELVRERFSADKASRAGKVLEAYLTESGRYVLAYPERLAAPLEPTTEESAAAVVDTH